MSLKSAVTNDEALLRGAKLATMQLTVPTTAGSRPQTLGNVLLRRAPGCDLVAYAQTIFLEDVGKSFWCPSPRLLQLRATSYVSPRVNQDYEALSSPTGLLWKFTFYENYNDGYYLGLDGMEMFDENGAQLFPLEQRIGSIQACPIHWQTLPEDERVPGSLFSLLRRVASRGLARRNTRLAGAVVPLSHLEERSQCFKRFSSQQRPTDLFSATTCFSCCLTSRCPCPHSPLQLREDAHARVKTFGISVDGNDVTWAR